MEIGNVVEEADEVPFSQKDEMVAVVRELDSLDPLFGEDDVRLG